MFSLTFNKLKADPQEQETSTSIPWWATFTRPSARPATVSPVSTSTAANTAANTAEATAAHAASADNHKYEGGEEGGVSYEDESEDDDDDRDDNVIFNTVRFRPVPGLEEHKSQQRRPGADTVGKLINVTGVSTKKNFYPINLDLRGKCAHQADARTNRACEQQR